MPKWSKVQYTPELIRSGRYSEKELRQAYAAGLKELRRRMSAFEAAGMTEARIFSDYGDLARDLPGLKDLKRAGKNGKLPADLVYGLTDISTALHNKRSTMAGEKKFRQEQIAKLDKSGYDFVNEENYDKWIGFLRAATNSGLKKVYGSNRVAEAFAELEAKGIDAEDMILRQQEAFEEYLEASV